MTPTTTAPAKLSSGVLAERKTRVTELLSRELDEDECSPTTRLSVNKAQNARLLLRHSKFGEPAYLKAEKILMSGGDYGSLLNSYTYWERMLVGMTDPTDYPPADG